MAPKLKLFGSLSLDGIKQAVKEIPSKIGEYKGEKQLKVTAAQWDDGNISLNIWNSESKTSINIGSLRVSTLDGPAPAQSTVADDDLPF